MYGNRVAEQAGSRFPRGAAIVRQHRNSAGDLLAVTAYVRQQSNYDSRNSDWVLGAVRPNGAVAKCSADKESFDKPGFVTFVEDSRLWVFEESSEGLRDYLQEGEPAKHITMPGAGPRGMTVKSSDRSIVDRYLAAKQGFVIRLEDGRVWVFRPGSEALQKFDATGDLAKRIILPAAGPNRMTLCGAENEVLHDYMYGNSGFVTRLVGGRLWVFKSGSPEWEDFNKNGGTGQTRHDAGRRSSRFDREGTRYRDDRSVSNHFKGDKAKTGCNHVYSRRTYRIRRFRIS